MLFRSNIDQSRQSASTWCGILGLATLSCILSFSVAAETQLLDVEKDELNFGFIKLTDMAPLAIAYENGYFEDEGLYVTLEPQANWKVLLDWQLLLVTVPKRISSHHSPWISTAMA